MNKELARIYAAAYAAHIEKGDMPLVARSRAEEAAKHFQNYFL